MVMKKKKGYAKGGAMKKKGYAAGGALLSHYLALNMRLLHVRKDRIRLQVSNSANNPPV